MSMLIKLFIKDFKLLIAERKSLLIFFLMPLVLTTILSFALQGSFSSDTPIEIIDIAIVKNYVIKDDLQLMASKFNLQDLEQNAEGAPDFEKMFFEDFLLDRQLENILNYEIMSQNAARESLDSGQIDGILVLPDKFIFDQMVNFYTPYRNEMDIQVIGRSDRQFSASMIQEIMGMYFDKLNLKIVQKNAFVSVAAPVLGVENTVEHFESVLTLSVKDQEIQKISIPGYKEMNSFTYYAIAMMAMFVLYAASFSGKALLREKQAFTLDRNTIAGVGYAVMLASKFLMTWVLVVVQMSLLIGYSKLVLNVDWVFTPQMLVSIAISALAVSGFGSLLSALTMYYDNPNLPAVFENIIIHIFALVGGSYIPADVLPLQVGFLKLIAVNGMILDLFIKVFQELSFEILMPQYGMLLIFSSATFALGILLLSRKERVDRA